MEILDAFHDLIHDKFCFRLGERMPMGDVSEQVTACAELIREVSVVRLFHVFTRLEEDVTLIGIGSQNRMH